MKEICNVIICSNCGIKTIYVGDYKFLCPSCREVYVSFLIQNIICDLCFYPVIVYNINPSIISVFPLSFCSNSKCPAFEVKNSNEINISWKRNIIASMKTQWYCVYYESDYNPVYANVSSFLDNYFNSVLKYVRKQM